jgi:hypothetical protein
LSGDGAHRKAASASAVPGHKNTGMLRAQPVDARDHERVALAQKFQNRPQFVPAEFSNGRD